MKRVKLRTNGPRKIGEATFSWICERDQVHHYSWLMLCLRSSWERVQVGA